MAFEQHELTTNYTEKHPEGFVKSVKSVVLFLCNQWCSFSH